MRATTSTHLCDTLRGCEWGVMTRQWKVATGPATASGGVGSAGPMIQGTSTGYTPVQNGSLGKGRPGGRQAARGGIVAAVQGRVMVWGVVGANGSAAPPNRVRNRELPQLGGGRWYAPIGANEAVPHLQKSPGLIIFLLGF